jgi:formate-dependent nitrite reductase cytochrome c552 subunit
MFFMSACSSRDQPTTFQPAPSAKTSPVVIHTPDKTTSIETGKVDDIGHPVRVACVTCHSLKKSDPLPADATELDQFHKGLKLSHGDLVCGQCHETGRVDVLRRADGKTLPMAEVMSLCAQCHGPQYRDYRRGSHGGMNGHWDLSRGPRVRNNCVDCHDPHAPKFVPAMPVLPPKDRFLTSPHGAPGHE